MAKRSRRSQRAERRAAERAAARGGGGSVEVSTRRTEDSDGPSWTMIGGVAAAVVALVVIAVVALGGDGGNGASNITSAETANQLAIATQNAGGSTISVYQGNAHTVMHADAALPDRFVASRRRAADPRLVLRHVVPLLRAHGAVRA